MNTGSIYNSPAGKAEIMALYDAALRRWTVPYETRVLPTRHGDTFVIASGDKSAPPLILLHGAASNAVSWVGDAGEYSRNFRVYAVDLPGEPGKSSENRPAWEGPAYAEWLEDVLNGLGAGKVSLVGISQGAWTAVKFAVTYPERVTRLVLLAPGGIVSIRFTFLLRVLLPSLLGQSRPDRTNRIIFGKQPIHPEAARFMTSIYTHFKTRVGKEVLFTDAELRRLDMPTLVIGGKEDALFDMKGVIRRVKKLVPGAKTILLPEMGHALVNLSETTLPFLEGEGG